MGDGGAAVSWLGVEHRDDCTVLAVHDGLVSGAGALFGGCGTAAAIVVAERVAAQPVVWASSHFGALAPAGSVVELTARTISAGRTMTHLEVIGSVEGRESFTTRVAAGRRPAHAVQGQWVGSPPVVADIESCPAFDHPVHADTWAARFEWRLAGTSAAADHQPWAAWWVRSREPIEPLVEAAVLCDYVTYGMGRALDRPMGGLSIDNVLRVHDPAAGTDAGGGDDGWRLLEVRPSWIAGGFGCGTARLFARSTLVADGTQSTIMNDWDWRLPDEREAEGGNDG